MVDLLFLVVDQAVLWSGTCGVAQLVDETYLRVGDDYDGNRFLDLSLNVSKLSGLLLSMAYSTLGVGGERDGEGQPVSQ